MSLGNVTRWANIVDPIASQSGLDALAVLAIIDVESGGDPNAEELTGGDAARGGSYGLMQVSNKTAQGYGFSGDVSGLLDPTTNVTYGCKYFADCVSQANGDLYGAWEAYNSGKTTGDTAYASKALAAYQALGGQYSPP